MEMPPTIFTMDEVALDAVLQVLLRLRLEQAMSRSLRAQLAHISRSLEVVSDAGSKRPHDISPGASSQQSKKVARRERSLSAPSVLPGSALSGDLDVAMEGGSPPIVGSSEWFSTLPLSIHQDVEEDVDEYFDFVMLNPSRYVDPFVIQSPSDVQMVNPETLLMDLEVASRLPRLQPLDDPFSARDTDEEEGSDEELLTEREVANKRRNEQRDRENPQQIQDQEQQHLNTEHNRTLKEYGPLPRVYGQFAPLHIMPEVNMSHANVLSPMLFHVSRSNTVHGWRLGEFMRKYELDPLWPPFSPNVSIPQHYSTS
jgi:hypothetical protein